VGFLLLGAAAEQQLAIYECGWQKTGVWFATGFGGFHNYLLVDKTISALSKFSGRRDLYLLRFVIYD